MEQRHLSVSQLKTYLLCLLKYFYRYVQRLPAPKSPELSLGIAVHSSLVVNFTQKIRSGEDLPLRNLLSLVRFGQNHSFSLLLLFLAAISHTSF